jgi:hypothetical protein
MNDKTFLDDLVSYSLDNLKTLEFVPNVNYDMPSEMLCEEAKEIKSSLVNKRKKDNEFYEDDD